MANINNDDDEDGDGDEAETSEDRHARIHAPDVYDKYNNTL